MWRNTMQKQIWTLVILLPISAGMLGIAHSSRAQESSGIGMSVSAVPQMKVHADTRRIYDKEHCFQQMERSEMPLYFDIYTDIAEGQVKLILYSLRDLKFEKLDTVTQSFTGGHAQIQYGPPHLGPGPYMATITASPDVGGISTKSLYFYETWKADISECWH